MIIYQEIGRIGVKVSAGRYVNEDGRWFELSANGEKGLWPIS